MFRRNLTIYSITIIAFFLTFCSASINATANTITLSTWDFAPYSGEERPSRGMTTEIIKKAFKEVGYTAKISFLPWKRGVQNTLHHEITGTFPYVKDAERKELFYFSDPMYSAKVRFFVNNKFNRKYEKDEDLLGLTICLPLGYSAGEIQRFLDKKIFTVYSPPDAKRCFEALTIGRVDVYSVNELTGWKTIDELYGNRKKFRTIGKVLQINDYYLIIAKSYPNAEKIIEEFNQGLKLLKEKQLYQEIIMKHLGK